MKTHFQVFQISLDITFHLSNGYTLCSHPTHRLHTHSHISIFFLYRYVSEIIHATLEIIVT